MIIGELRLVSDSMGFFRFRQSLITHFNTDTGRRVPKTLVFLKEKYYKYLRCSDTCTQLTEYHMAFGKFALIKHLIS